MPDLRSVLASNLLTGVNIVDATVLPTNLIESSTDPTIKVYTFLQKIVQGAYGEECKLPPRDEVMKLCDISNHNILKAALIRLHDLGFIVLSGGVNEKGRRVRFRVILRPLRSLVVNVLDTPEELTETDRKKLRPDATGAFNIIYLM